MENITTTLDIVYHAIQILLDIDHSNLTLEQKIAIIRAIEELEDARCVLYKEKNNLREIVTNQKFTS